MYLEYIDQFNLELFYLSFTLIFAVVGVYFLAKGFTWFIKTLFEIKK
jgi:hypothetical protein